MVAKVDQIISEINKNVTHFLPQMQFKINPTIKLTGTATIKENHAIFLPYQELFDNLAKDPKTPSLKYWMWDGIHPTAAGHKKMAEMWIKTVGDKL